MTSARGVYYRDFGLAMVGYALVLVASILVVQANPGSLWRVPLALAPMVPATFGLLAFVRFLGRMDELQRQIQLEALAFAFGGTALITFGYGFLQGAADFPNLSFFAVWPLMAALWLVGLALANRRYR